MKRFLLFVLLAVIAVLAVLFVVRRGAGAAQSPITSLLPADTAVYAYFPDWEKSRDAWHKTDLFALIHEPAMQDFLRKPRTQIPKHGATVKMRHDIGALRMHDAFLATNTFDAVRIVGGFGFRCDEKQATVIIEQWKTRALRKVPGAQRSATDYQRHHIDVINGRQISLASTIAGDRFLVATNPDDLKAMLDRLDGRLKTPALESDANFRATMKSMHSNYAWIFYCQPKLLAQKLTALRAKAGVSPPAGQQTVLDKIQGLAYATIFDGGKIRDVGFSLMPKAATANLTRETLPLASADTFLYFASQLNSEQMEMVKQSAQAPPWDKITEALTAAGLTFDDFKVAFGDELSVLLNWPANARIPAGVITLPVKDAARANKIVAALTASSAWQASARNNAQYYLAPSLENLFAFNPMVAVSNRMLVFGIDAASVDDAITQKAPATPLAGTESYRGASKLVPDPQQSFIYLNLPELYTRLDTTLRPALQLSAAFVPGLSDKIDLQKLPAADVITRHLSPTVSSASYAGNGYRSESVGTITIGQAAAVGIASYAGFTILKYRSALQNAGGWRGQSQRIPAATPAPSTSPFLPVISPTPPAATPTPVP